MRPKNCENCSQSLKLGHYKPRTVRPLDGGAPPEVRCMMLVRSARCIGHQCPLNVQWTGMDYSSPTAIGPFPRPTRCPISLDHDQLIRSYRSANVTTKS